MDLQEPQIEKINKFNSDERLNPEELPKSTQNDQIEALDDI